MHSISLQEFNERYSNINFKTLDIKLVCETFYDIGIKGYYLIHKIIEDKEVMWILIYPNKSYISDTYSNSTFADFEMKISQISGKKLNIMLQNTYPHIGSCFIRYLPELNIELCEFQYTYGNVHRIITNNNTEISHVKLLLEHDIIKDFEIPEDNWIPFERDPYYDLTDEE